MSVKTETEKLVCDFCNEPITDPRLAYALVDFHYGDPGAHYVHDEWCRALYTAKYPKLLDREERLDEFLARLTEDEKKARSVLIKKGWIRRANPHETTAGDASRET